VIGTIAGVLIDEKQLTKLLSDCKTELISGFKSKEKGKKTFSAFLVWNKEENRIFFEFPEKNATNEESNYICPVCHEHKLMKSKYYYSCNCGFKLNSLIAGKELSDEQIKKLLLCGETDMISGFFSARTRKMFSAKLVLKDNKLDFCFPEKKYDMEAGL
jgi:DNA topoisomerase-3